MNEHLCCMWGEDREPSNPCRSCGQCKRYARDPNPPEHVPNRMLLVGFGPRPYDWLIDGA